VSGGTLEYRLGDPYNIYGERMEVHLHLGGASKFSTFSNSSNTLYVRAINFNLTTAAVYPVRVTAKTHTEHYFEQYNNYFNLTVLPLASEEPPTKVAVQAKEHLEVKNDKYLPAWTGLLLDRLEAEAFNASKPMPYVADLSLDGVFTIGWDTWMAVPPGGLKLIRETKVASLEPAEWAAERTSVWDERDLIQRDLTLTDSLRVVMEDEEGNPVDAILDWSVVSFDRDFTKLKLELKDADSIIDTYLRVTFWNVEFFRSERGETVRRGTTLVWHVYRQASKESFQYAESVSGISVFQGVTFLLSLFYCIVNNKRQSLCLLISSLQLKSYLAMLNTHMPSGLFIILGTYLDYLRLKIPSLTLKLNDNFDESRRAAYVAEDPVIFNRENKFIELFGYGDFFCTNAPILLGLFAFLLFFYVLSTLKDRLPIELRQRLPMVLRPNHEIRLSNMVLAFFKFAYLELAVCVCISLKTSNLSSS